MQAERPGVVQLGFHELGGQAAALRGGVNGDGAEQSVRAVDFQRGERDGTFLVFGQEGVR
ncbi:hypothetical protein GCM10008960_19710 [Deinococcus sedimenti]|uniref:Uncharacterized protein n=1 Tax=Deinococcus sedimenti TaxID=1867090 RepID=A0ABQ2S338_9DEIO|nr:hypothetical protein GCM10008960_19710 [Deinococcus sedimenti]